MKKNAFIYFGTNPKKNPKRFKKIKRHDSGAKPAQTSSYISRTFNKTIMCLKQNKNNIIKLVLSIYDHVTWIAAEIGVHIKWLMYAT